LAYLNPHAASRHAGETSSADAEQAMQLRVTAPDSGLANCICVQASLRHRHVLLIFAASCYRCLRTNARLLRRLIIGTFLLHAALRMWGLNPGILLRRPGSQQRSLGTQACGSALVCSATSQPTFRSAGLRCAPDVESQRRLPRRNFFGFACLA